jgi:hypothetical protein
MGGWIDEWTGWMGGMTVRDSPKKGVALVFYGRLEFGSHVAIGCECS